MRTYSPENERTKRRYFAYLKEAMRLDESTVDAVAKSLHRFEEHTSFQDFKAFHIEQAISFKRRLAGQNAKRSGKQLSQATLYSTLTQLKRFFRWLALQPGYKSRLNYLDAEYFNLSDKDTRVATAVRQQRVPTVEQIKQVLETLPRKTEIECRNRALIAFTLVTGARDGAIASMKLKHVDLAANCVHQDARDVKTKNSKTFDTFFFPVGEEVIQIVKAWFIHLRVEKGWHDDDPLFPAGRMVVGETGLFELSGLDRVHWSNASPIRTIFRNAFQSAGLPYFNPHSFRNALVRLGQQRCTSPEEYKAWSQNLGHAKVLTTLESYGTVPNDRQGEILRGLAVSKQAPNGEEILARLEKLLSPLNKGAN